MESLLPRPYLYIAPCFGCQKGMSMSIIRFTCRVKLATSAHLPNSTTLNADGVVVNSAEAGIRSGNQLDERTNLFIAWFRETKSFVAFVRFIANKSLVIAQSDLTSKDA